MEKCIGNPFGYLDYRVLLNDDFLARSIRKRDYSLRAYSRDIGLSPGFLSEVLSGKKELSLGSGREVFAKLGFTKSEIEYAEKLIQSKSARDLHEREDALRFVRDRYARSGYVDFQERHGFIQSADHFIIYGMIRRISSFAVIKNLASRLFIPESRVVEVLTDLIAGQYVKQEGERLSVVEERLVVQNGTKMLELTAEFSRRLTSLIYAEGGVSAPDRTTHALILGFDPVSFDLAIEAHRHYVRTLSRLAKNSKDPVSFAFMTDQFFVVPVPPAPSEKVQPDAP